MIMLLQYDKVKLRHFCEEDIANKVRWINDPENNKYLHYDLPLEKEKTLQWYRNKDDNNRLDLVIEYDEIPIGLIGLLEIERINKKAEFYICLGEKQYKRRGIAKTAVKLLIDYAFNHLNLKKVYLNVDADNIAACYLYEKSGFVCEGYFKQDMFHRGQYIDRKRYSILSEYKDERMNILLLSVGTRNKVVQYFKQTFSGNGCVVATDMSELAPALYEADKFYIVPPITDASYINVIFDICNKEKIKGVLSLIDPELSLLSKHKEEFDSLGITVIGSSYELCERALDKMEMYRWLYNNGYNCAKSYTDKESFYADEKAGIITYPVFVKPIRGSASIAISKVYNKETLELLFANNDNLMIQEYLDGQEIGADVYIDMISGEVVSIFTKKKIVMRAGETDKAVSFKDEKLFDLIKAFCKDSGWLGQIDIDIFNVEGKYYISEVNPRFGGGYPHAYESGCNHMKMILNNLDGIENKENIGKYDSDVYMMKYNEIMVKK